MAIKQLAWAFNLDGFESAADRHIFLECVYWADSRGIIRLSQQELAERTVVSPRSVGRALDNLTKADLLKKLGHGRYGITSSAERERKSDPAWRTFRDWALKEVQFYHDANAPMTDELLAACFLEPVEFKRLYGTELGDAYRRNFALGVERGWLVFHRKPSEADAPTYRLTIPFDELGLVRRED